MQAKGPVPEGRSRCSMVVAQDCLYVFGGWNRTHSYADLYQFEIGTLTPYVCVTLTWVQPPIRGVASSCAMSTVSSRAASSITLV